MDRDTGARQQAVTQTLPAENPMFDRWLQRGLSQHYAETLREPLPAAWLALLEAAPEKP